LLRAIYYFQSDSISSRSIHNSNANLLAGIGVLGLKQIVDQFAESECAVKRTHQLFGGARVGFVGVERATAGWETFSASAWAQKK